VTETRAPFNGAPSLFNRNLRRFLHLLGSCQPLLEAVQCRSTDYDHRGGSVSRMSLRRNHLNDDRRVAGHCVRHNTLQRLLGRRSPVLAIDRLGDINIGRTRSVAVMRSRWS
jgi:hypothetical protein